jgi:hypothetical protein
MQKRSDLVLQLSLLKNTFINYDKSLKINYKQYIMEESTELSVTYKIHSIA